MMKGFRRAGAGLAVAALTVEVPMTGVDQARADEAPPATTDTVGYGQEVGVFWENHRG